MVSLTEGDKLFLSRVADALSDMGVKHPEDVTPELLEKACQKVCDRDQVLWLAAMATNDVGAEIRNNLASEVYDNIIRGKKA